MKFFFFLKFKGGKWNIFNSLGGEKNFFKFKDKK